MGVPELRNAELLHVLLKVNIHEQDWILLQTKKLSTPKFNSVDDCKHFVS